MTTAVALRPVRTEDEGFLFDLYAGTRAGELALVSWDAAQQDAFLRMQFDVQRRSYAMQFPDADHRIIWLDDEPIGRLLVNRADDGILLVDVALRPEWRNVGIGTVLIRSLQREAARAGKPVRLHVEPLNPARRLYERLGFAPIGGNGITLELEWRPGPARAGPPGAEAPG